VACFIAVYLLMLGSEVLDAAFDWMPRNGSDYLMWLGYLLGMFGFTCILFNEFISN